MWFVIAWWGDPHDKPGRTRAATTFILYTLIGSAIMLLGFLLVHARTGTFDIVELTALGGSGISTTTQVLAAVAIMGGLAVKAPMWPLHTWLPDAHWKAPTIGSVLLAGVLLKMGTYGMVRIAVPVVPEGMREIAPWIGGLAVVGIIYGSLACLGAARPQAARRLLQRWAHGFRPARHRVHVATGHQRRAVRQHRPRPHHRAAVLPRRRHQGPLRQQRSRGPR